MKLNQKGAVDMIVIALLAIVVVGVAVYTLTNSSNGDPETANDSQMESQLSFSNDYVNLSYPLGWEVQDSSNTSAEFSSPNYRENIEKGDGSALEGARFGWFYVPDASFEDYTSNLEREEIEYLIVSKPDDENGLEFVDIRAIDRGTASVIRVYTDPVDLEIENEIKRGGVSLLTYVGVPIADSVPAPEQAEFFNEFQDFINSHSFVE